MVNDLVTILLCVIALMVLADYSRRPPKGKEKVMDDEET
jgi:hypothetical protein